nr:glycosyltransferase [Priestia megaterium]
MNNLKILLYGDQNLNIMDGSAIWLTSLANILTYDRSVDLSILLKSPIKRKHVITNIQNIEDIEFINPFKRESKIMFKNSNRMQPEEASKLIEKLDQENDYDLIITRGKILTNHCLNRDFSKKLIPYITDFSYDDKSKDIKLFKKIYKKCPKIFVQTEEMKNMLSTKFGISKDIFITLPPTVNDSNKSPYFGYEDFSIVYTGKFAEDWEIISMYDSFIEAKKQVDTLTLNIAGDKFQGGLIEQKDEIIDKFENTKGINWVGAVSRSESLKLIKSSDLGFAYRSKKVDNNNSVELSTKFLEYGIQGKPVVVRKIKQYVNLLGDDYPFYCNNYNELVEKIVLAFSDQELYKKGAIACYNASKKYQFSIVSKCILDQLKKLKPAKKKTILFAGHDFKFIYWYIDYCEKLEGIKVLVDKWSGHNSHNYHRSLNLLKQADIIFCEWGLGNAEFYSNNKLKGQSLFIRVHRQELNSNYLDNVNYTNVNKVIAISAHIFEEFNRIKKIPREKMIIIPNMVDVDRFKLPKKQNSEYHLGILGILPKLKRLDRALSILEKLCEEDDKYKLYIKGKLPDELPWINNRPEELSYYRQVFERIEKSPWKNNIVFDPHGDDVADWFSNINYILSTSEIESFHLAPMEGMASGAIPVVFNWPGAETLYPKENIVNGVNEAVQVILNHNRKNISLSVKYQGIVNKFGKETVKKQLNSLML